MNAKNKICTKCGGSFPETKEFFYIDKANGNIFISRCKFCKSKQTLESKRKHYDKHRPKVNEYEKKRQKLKVKKLKLSYVAFVLKQTMNIPKKYIQANKELIYAKRELILLNRQLRNEPSNKVQ